jgi:hypothetical protein
MDYDHLMKCLTNGLAQPAGILRFTLFYSLGVSECRLWVCIPLFLLNAQFGMSSNQNSCLLVQENFFHAASKVDYLTLRS